MKKVFQRFILLFLAVITTMLFTACASHTHTFSEEWTYNATEHWHQATCEHKNEISEKGEHTFGGWTVKTQPTETSEGLEERSCSVCGYKETRVVPKTTHVHTFSDEWSFNETEHWHNATCDHKDVVSEKAAHTYGDWEIITEAGYGTKGSKSHTCTVCGYEEIVEIPARNYFIDEEAITLIEACFDTRDAVISFSLSRGDFTDVEIISIKDQKVKIAERNRVIYFANKAGSLYKYSSENNFYETALNNEADLRLATNGINAASILNYIMDSNLDMHEYLETSDFSFALNEDGSYSITHNADTEAIKGSLAYFIEYATYVKFNELSLEIGGSLDIGATYKLSINLDYEDVTIPEHTHVYSEDWSYDAEGHYHEALCPDGEEKHGLEAHTFGEWIIVTEAGYKTAGSKKHVCEVCGYEEIVEIPARDYYLDEELLELIKNQFNSNVRRGEIIDRKDESVVEVLCYNNIFKVIYYLEDGRTDSYNKYTDDAIYTYESSTGYYEEKYDGLPADVVKKLFTLGGVFNTLTESNVDFDALFTTDKFEFEYDKENDAYKVTRKDVDDLITYEDASNESADFLQYYIDITKVVKFVDDSIVFVCNDEHSDYVIALGLNEIDEIIIPEHTHVYEEDWQYDETSHWHNPICPDGEEKHVLAPHTFGEWEVTIEATETKAGEKKHTCDVCGYTETEVIPMTGEVFSNFVWAADYKSALAVYLLGDVEHAYAARVEETSVTYCDKEGLITYTATHGDNTDTVQLPLPATGHNWDTPTYVWNDDNTKVTATRVCKNDNTHVETETVDVTSQIIPPTCEVGGKTVLTATFTNKTFETQTKDVDIKDPKGHKYEIQTVEYNTEKDKAVLSEKCGNCNDERTRELDIKVVADINGESGEVAVKGIVAEIYKNGNYTGYYLKDNLKDSKTLYLLSLVKPENMVIEVGDELIVYGIASIKVDSNNRLQLNSGCKALSLKHVEYSIFTQQADFTINLNDEVISGSDVTFTLTPVKSSDQVVDVTANGEDISPDNSGIYTLHINGDIELAASVYDKCKKQVTVYSSYTEGTSTDPVVDGASYLITTTYDENQYYLPSDGTTSLPKAVIVDENIESINLWTFEKVDGGYLIKNSNNYLMAINQAQGTSIKNSANPTVWILEIVDEVNHLYTLKYKTNNDNANPTYRYLGIYKGSDWRNYTTADDSNYKDNSNLSSANRIKLKAFVENTLIDNHDLEKIAGVPATKTTAGYKEYYVCSVCGKFFYYDSGNLVLIGGNEELELWKTKDHPGYDEPLSDHYVIPTESTELPAVAATFKSAGKKVAYLYTYLAKEGEDANLYPTRYEYYDEDNLLVAFSEETYNEWISSTGNGYIAPTGLKVALNVGFGGDASIDLDSTKYSNGYVDKNSVSSFNVITNPIDSDVFELEKIVVNGEEITGNEITGYGELNEMTIEVSFEIISYAFVKLTSVNDLVDGGKYLILSSAKGKVLNSSSSTLSTDNYISYDGINNVFNPDAALLAATFIISKESTGYSIKSTANKYIYHTGSGNTLDLSDTMVANSISFDNSGDALISSDNRTLKCNNNNSTFRYYTSGQTAIQLYLFCEPTAEKLLAHSASLFNDTYDGLDNVEIPYGITLEISQNDYISQADGIATIAKNNTFTDSSVTLTFKIDGNTEVNPLEKTVVVKGLTHAVISADTHELTLVQNNDDKYTVQYEKDGATITINATATSVNVNQLAVGEEFSFTISTDVGHAVKSVKINDVLVEAVSNVYNGIATQSTNINIEIEESKVGTLFFGEQALTNENGFTAVTEINNVNVTVAATAQYLYTGQPFSFTVTLQRKSGDKYHYVKKAKINGDEVEDNENVYNAILVENNVITIEVEKETITDTLTATLIGVTSYSDWSEKSDKSAAVYAGNSTQNNANAIQLRSTKNSGIISLISGGFIKSITFNWNSGTVDGRKINVYASNTRYTSSSALYVENLATITSKTYNNASSIDTYLFESEYRYIGLKSDSDAMYFDSIEITWYVTDDSVNAVENYVDSLLTTEAEKFTLEYNAEAVVTLSTGISAVVKSGEGTTISVPTVTIAKNMNPTEDVLNTITLGYTFANKNYTKDVTYTRVRRAATEIYSEAKEKFSVDSFNEATEINMDNEYLIVSSNNALVTFANGILSIAKNETEDDVLVTLTFTIENVAISDTKEITLLGTNSQIPVSLTVNETSYTSEDTTKLVKNGNEYTWKCSQVFGEGNTAVTVTYDVGATIDNAEAGQSVTFVVNGFKIGEDATSDYVVDTFKLNNVDVNFDNVNNNYPVTFVDGVNSVSVILKKDGPTTVIVSVEDYAADNSWENSKKYTSMTLDNIITASVSGGGNTGKYYTSGNEWRLYQTENATITISAASGYTITSVKITYNITNAGVLKDGDTDIASTSVVSVNGTSKTFTVGNTGTATNGQVKITEIEVIYQANE